MQVEFLIQNETSRSVRLGNWIYTHYYRTGRGEWQYAPEETLQEVAIKCERERDAQNLSAASSASGARRAPLSLL
jgi:hypothetical protein